MMITAPQTPGPRVPSQAWAVEADPATVVSAVDEVGDLTVVTYTEDDHATSAQQLTPQPVVVAYYDESGQEE